MNNKIKTYTVDEFGVRNYNTLFSLLFSLIALYGIIAILAFPLYYYELSVDYSNIKSYRDAFWTLQMSASTIGFGDFYPVTAEGRLIVAAMFYIGIGLVSFVGAQFVNKFIGFTDTNVKNRELRRQNKEILEHNKLLEAKIDNLVSKIEQLVDDKTKGS